MVPYEARYGVPGVRRRVIAIFPNARPIRLAPLRREAADVLTDMVSGRRRVSASGSAKRLAALSLYAEVVSTVSIVDGRRVNERAPPEARQREREEHRGIRRVRRSRRNGLRGSVHLTLTLCLGR